MAMNRVQFQPGLSLHGFLHRYAGEQAGEQALEHARWPQGSACPRCGGTHATRFRRGRLPYWQRCACRRQTSLVADTVFVHTHQPLSTWFLALYLLPHTKTNMAALELIRS